MYSNEMKHDLFRTEKGEYGLRLLLTSTWDDAIEEYIYEYNVLELYINYAWGWQGHDVEFLRRLSHLRALFLLDWRLEEVAPIHALHALRWLKLASGSRKRIDFAAFPDLEHCNFEWQVNSPSLFGCTKLKSLWLNKYSGKNTDAFTALALLES